MTTPSTGIAAPLDWQTFRTNSVFNLVTDLQTFKVVAELPITGIWTDREARSKCAHIIYDHLLEVLTTAKLHYPNRLVVSEGERRMTFDYGDDAFGFEVVLDGSFITIRRAGSSLDRFFVWYMKVAPHFRLLIEKVSAALNEVIQSSFGLSRPMSVQRAEISFQVVAFDFCRPADRANVQRNALLMKQVLPRAPGVDGSLVPITDELESFGRLDAKFAKWFESEGNRWTEVYSVEAPANRDWTTLWFTFSRIGETFVRVDATGGETRVAFDGGRFLGDYLGPLFGMFRDRGLTRFLAEITDGFEFQTAASHPS